MIRHRADEMLQAYLAHGHPDRPGADPLIAMLATHGSISEPTKKKTSRGIRNDVIR